MGFLRAAGVQGEGLPTAPAWPLLKALFLAGGLKTGGGGGNLDWYAPENIARLPVGKVLAEVLVGADF